MPWDLDETIAALSSPPGPGARGIVRVTGPAAVEILTQLFTPNNQDALDLALDRGQAARHVGFVRLVGDFKIPVAVFVWPTARSYTGQPLVEFHLTGAPVLLDELLTLLFSHRARPARQGEFTLRAFLAGKLDLTQAEAVLGVIHARDDAELNTALSQLSGQLSGNLHALKASLLDHLADLEAGLDFVEEDIDFVDRTDFIHRLEEAIADTELLFLQSQQQFQQDHPWRVVLAGLPNAGKSTLFNTLIGSSEAIVSPIQGTTRDYLAYQLNWRNLRLELIDTAGWEQTSLGPMQRAQQLRETIISQADVIIWCTSQPMLMDSLQSQINLLHLEELHHSHESVLHCLTMTDLDYDHEFERGHAGLHFDLMTSAHQHTGIDKLKEMIINSCSVHQQGEHRLLVGSTAARCRHTLSIALERLQSAHQLALSNAGDELIATELRSGLEELGKLTGEIYTDDLLDQIFSKFCIGK